MASARSFATKAAFALFIGFGMFRSFTFVCLLIATFFVGFGVSAQEIVFEDRFEGSLKPGWVWVRENSACRRFVNNALEILTEPFGEREARNALVRPLNFLPWQNGGFGSPYRIETECGFVSKPRAQYQQCGVYWIHDERIVFKLVFENVDGTIYVYPNKVPLNAQGGRLRITVNGQNILAEFCGLGESSFRRVYEGKIECGPNDLISLQCWNGPQKGLDLEQWARFRYFRVEKLN